MRPKVLFALLLCSCAVIYVHAEETCAEHLFCSDCIRSFLGCGWCAKEGSCTTVQGTCADADWISPRGKAVWIEDVHPFVHPSLAEVHLRPGIPFVFNISVTNERLPLDLMFVEDMSSSMSDDVAQIESSANQIFTRVQAEIHAQSALGFSSYVEKTAKPGGDPQGCATTGTIYNAHGCDCWPFRLDRTLTQSSTDFATALSTLSASFNWDAEEGAPEAILHTAVCDEVLWRPYSRKFVDAGLTPMLAEKVNGPLRVKECLGHVECRLHQVVQVGEGPTAACLLIGNVVAASANASVYYGDRYHFDASDPYKTSLHHGGGKLYFKAASLQ